MAISPCSNWDDMGSQRAPKSLSYCLRVVPIPCSSYKHHKLHHNSTCPQACSATHAKSPHTRHYTQTEKKLNQKHHQWTHHYTSETGTADFDLSILTSTRFSFLDKQYRGAAFLFAFSIPLSLAFFHDQSDSMYLLSRDCLHVFYPSVDSGVSYTDACHRIVGGSWGVTSVPGSTAYSAVIGKWLSISVSIQRWYGSPSLSTTSIFCWPWLYPLLTTQLTQLRSTTHP